jgi:hypothetical protein
MEFGMRVRGWAAVILAGCDPATAVVLPAFDEESAAYRGTPALIWGAAEGEAVGFTGFGSPVLSTGDTERWRVSVPGRPPADVACAGDSLWWLDRGFFARHDPDDLAERWRRGVINPTGVIVRGEQVFVSTSEGTKVLAFDLSDGRPRPELDVELGGRGRVTGLTWFAGGYAAWVADDGANPIGRMVVVEGDQVVGDFGLDPWLPMGVAGLFSDVTYLAPAAVVDGEGAALVQVRHQDPAQGAAVLEISTITGSVVPLVRTEAPFGVAVDPQGLGLWAVLIGADGSYVLERTGDRARRPFRGGNNGDFPIGDLLAVATDGGVWANAAYTPPDSFGSGLVRLDPGGTPSERWSAPFDKSIGNSATRVLRICR